MCAHHIPDPPPAGSRIEAMLTWLGGGHLRELGGPHERSTHAITGVVVLLDALLAGLVATLAVAGSTRWPVPSFLPLTLLIGVLVGAVTRAVATGPARGWPGIVGRGTVAVAVGIVVGELAALVLFSGTIDRRLDEQAARTAYATPAVAQASADIGRTRSARAALDEAVEQARAHRDEALVVARCEYNPTPACPETHITGVPGPGPETRTANELLADAQGELDTALAARERTAPQLDAEISAGGLAITQARETAIVQADRGLGARWVAMNDHTSDSVGALLVRLFTSAFFALLMLLPLILTLWRGETTHDRSAVARAERDRAELQADTAIAVKRAEVRAAAEILWAEQQLASARIAVEAQLEIDRAQHRRRVSEAVDVPVQAVSHRIEQEPEPVHEDVYLPIAAEAEAASLAAGQSPADGHNVPVDTPEDLPAVVGSGSAVQPRGERETSLIPTIPGVTRAAARWVRPLVPPFVARAFDTTTTPPLRVARQVFEEVEEITFLLKRTHKVTVSSEESPPPQGEQRSTVAEPRADPRRVESSILRPASRGAATQPDHPLGPALAGDASLGLTGRQGQAELTEQGGPRQLPSAE
jgi:Domain of unknown function (DUF4407)